MKLPLIAMGVLFLGLLAVYAFFQAHKAKRPAPAWDGEHTASSQAMAEMVSDTLRIYALLAGGALLSMVFGKPGLFQQWAAWAVVGLQVLKWFTIAREMAMPSLVLRLAVLVCLTYLWLFQLPFFDIAPQ